MANKNATATSEQELSMFESHVNNVLEQGGHNVQHQFVSPPAPQPTHVTMTMLDVNSLNGLTAAAASSVKEIQAMREEIKAERQERDERSADIYWTIGLTAVGTAAVIGAGAWAYGAFDGKE